MATVHQDVYGPDWPLGFIEVVAAGTAVRLTSLVDPTAVDAPETPTEGVAAARRTSPRVRQLIVQAVKPGFKGSGLVDNAGYVYIVRYGGNKDDSGTIIKRLYPGDTCEIPPTGIAGHTAFSPYRYAVDADNSGDGVLVTAFL